MTYFRAAAIIAFIFVLLFYCPRGASADTVYLKNGRQMECIVRVQGKDTVELEVEIGTIRLRTSEILKIEKLSETDNTKMVARWKMRRVKSDEARAAWQREEEERQEKEQSRKSREPKETDVKLASGHMVVTATINKTVSAQLLVDTGASVVVLSRSIGEKLGLVSAADIPGSKKMSGIQLQVADGRKVDAKYVVLDSVAVNESLAEKVEAAIFLSPQSDITYDGVLGMSYLKLFNVGFNNKENKLILEKLK